MYRLSPDGVIEDNKIYIFHALGFRDGLISQSRNGSSCLPYIVCGISCNDLQAAMHDLPRIWAGLCVPKGMLGSHPYT